jgi:hypothetical protein
MESVFFAIEDFVKSLEEAFPPSSMKEDSLLKYGKMIAIIKKSDPEIKENSIKKLVGGFRKFFEHESVSRAFLENNLNLVKNVPIVYGDSQKVKLDIQRFIRSDQATRDCIFEHLRNIANLLEIKFNSSDHTPDKIFKNILGDDASTDEGKIIQTMFDKFGSKINDSTNPLELATEFMSDGSMDEFTNIMKDVKLKPKTIKKMLMNIINNVIPDEDDSIPAIEGSQ